MRCIHWRTGAGSPSARSLTAVRPALTGIAIGIMVSIWAAQFLQSFLHQVDARDPWTLASVAVTLVAAALVAAWLPAHRASCTDPTEVLRLQ